MSYNEQVLNLVKVGERPIAGVDTTRQQHPARRPLRENFFPGFFRKRQAYCGTVINSRTCPFRSLK